MLPLRLSLPLCFLSAGLLAFAADAPAPAPTAADEIEEDDADDVMKLAAFNVSADRLETFGFRVGWHLGNPFGSTTPWIAAVLPNTAASKAGLRPGDLILTTDGASSTVTLFSMSKWRKIFQRKNAEIAAGKKTVTWVLEVQTPGEPQKRTVRLSIPTPPPHWGATKWQPPTDRAPVSVEPGPLAERAQRLLENGIWIKRGFPRALAYASSDLEPQVGYEWSLQNGKERHRVFVTQQHGPTEIVFEMFGENRYEVFLTSPSGALEKAVYRPAPRKQPEEMPLDDAREAFHSELSFWLNDVGRVTGRWPFEVKKTASLVANADGTSSTPTPKSAGAIPMGQRAERFLKLTPATDAQKILFADALAKLGADEGQWAYTEKSTALDSKRVTLVRVDPSKPDAERCTLLKIDNKPPTPAEEKQWRFEGRDVSASLGELPPIRALVDVDDLRVFADEVAAIVFELPLRGGNKEFPAEKFQALFRVNKTHRGFEDFAVKLRESFRVAGVVSINEAGIEARFQTFDPRYAPQPVYLKAGGAVRVLLVKFARAFESTRTDYQRVTPYEEK